MSGLIYLVTGASRGIGRAYTSALLQRNSPSHINTTVIAAVRNPDDSTSKSLFDIKPVNGNRLIVVKIDSAQDDDPKKAVEDLKTEYGIDHLDVSLVLFFLKHFGRVMADSVVLFFPRPYRWLLQMLGPIWSGK